MAFAKFKRLRQIGFVLGKYGLGTFLPTPALRVLGIEKTDEEGKVFKELSTGEKLCKAFEELGPTYIKLGQLLSIRRDIVPEEVAEELKKLQDQVTPVPFEQIKPIIEKELAGNINEFFAWFNEKPLASASISQVYEATLLESGQSVVVKVRKPDIVEDIKGDMEILFWIADLMQKHSSFAKRFDFRGIVEEFFLAMKEELDLLIEKKNTEKFIRNFSDESWSMVKFPEMIDRYSTSSILVMEKIEGVKLYDFIKNSDEYARKSAATVGARLFMKMVFIDGFFHGDLHAGNLFFMNDGTIAVIDCGMTGALDAFTREKIAEMFLAFASRDYAKLAGIYLDLSNSDVGTERKQLAKDIRVVVDSLPEKLKDINIQQLFSQILSILYKHKLKIPSSLTMLMKAISHTEGLGRELDPDFDFLSESEEFATILLKSRYTPERIAGDIFQTSMQFMDMVKKLPENINDIIEKIERGTLQHRLLFLLSQSERRFFSKIATRISSAFFMTGSLLAFKSFHDAGFSVLIMIFFIFSFALFVLTFRKEKE